MWGGRGCSHQGPAGFLGVQPQVASKHVYFEAAQDAISTSAPEHTGVSELMWHQKTKAIQQVRARARDTEVVPVEGDVVASTGCPTGSHAGWHVCRPHDRAQRLACNWPQCRSGSLLKLGQGSRVHSPRPPTRPRWVPAVITVCAVPVAWLGMLQSQAWLLHLSSIAGTCRSRWAHARLWAG